MPALKTNAGLATTFEQKTKALRARFYPDPTADLSDITEELSYIPTMAQVKRQIESDKIADFLR
jgi:hypothetical protein